MKNEAPNVREVAPPNPIKENKIFLPNPLLPPLPETKPAMLPTPAIISANSPTIIAVVMQYQ